MISFLFTSHFHLIDFFDNKCFYFIFFIFVEIIEVRYLISESKSEAFTNGISIVCIYVISMCWMLSGRKIEKLKQRPRVWCWLSEFNRFFTFRFVRHREHALVNEFSDTTTTGKQLNCLDTTTNTHDWIYFTSNCGYDYLKKQKIPKKIVWSK